MPEGTPQGFDLSLRWVGGIFERSGINIVCVEVGVFPIPFEGSPILERLKNNQALSGILQRRIDHFALFFSILT